MNRRPMPAAARKRFEKELGLGRLSDDPKIAWGALTRAHILAQPWAGPHVRCHFAMLVYGLRTRDGREVLGQLVRIVVAAPGSWTGRIPVGNTGRSDVALTLPMPVPEELADLLAPSSSTSRLDTP